MSDKREVHALDYAIVDLVSALNRLFIAATPNIVLRVDRGLNVATWEEPESRYQESESRSKEIKALIYPVGWPPESYIYARFLWQCGVWSAFEGYMRAPHIQGEEKLLSHQFDFYFEHYPPELSPRGGLAEEFFRERVQTP